MHDITDANYKHVKNMRKGIKIKSLGEYNDLYVQSETLLANNFQNFQNKYIEVSGLDPAHLLSAPPLEW